MKASIEARLVRAYRSQDGQWIAVCRAGGESYALTLPATFPFAEGKRVRVIIERPGRAELAT